MDNALMERLAEILEDLSEVMDPWSRIELEVFADYLHRTVVALETIAACVDEQNRIRIDSKAK